MSKAEERAHECFPNEDIESKKARFGFLLGYHQAEKDLELDWEDMREICNIQYIVLNEYNDYNEPSGSILYKEVLKRFKESKNK